MMNRLFFIMILMFSLYTVKAQDTVSRDAAGKIVFKIACTASIKPEKPLFILDGEVVNEETANNIDPKKIKEINVLKGASATALYGTQGSKGVILISTKKKKSKK